MALEMPGKLRELFFSYFVATLLTQHQRLLLYSDADISRYLAVDDLYSGFPLLLESPRIVFV